jgi:hypothetical protein
MVPMLGSVMLGRLVGAMMLSMMMRRLGKNQ